MLNPLTVPPVAVDGVQVPCYELGLACDPMRIAVQGLDGSAGGVGHTLGTLS
jgi:hypothetical protein